VGLLVQAKAVGRQIQQEAEMTKYEMQSSPSSMKLHSVVCTWHVYLFRVLNELSRYAQKFQTRQIHKVNNKLTNMLGTEEHIPRFKLHLATFHNMNICTTVVATESTVFKINVLLLKFSSKSVQL
jgi:hypothetical protein